MAGIKITDLLALATAATDDYLCIVDVSDTTSSPEGTTKKIEVGNIVDIESGTWTPTFSNFDDAITAATLTEAYYNRIGNVVNCVISGTMDIDFSGVGVTSGEFDFTFPVATTSNNARGVASINEPKQCNGFVRAEKIVLVSEDTTLIASGTSFYAVFQYLIV
jgi:hypothetical protein